MIEIDLRQFFKSRAKLAGLDSYIQKAEIMAGEGNDVILTGKAPIWLYLKVAHALHGKVTKLIYINPTTKAKGGVVIFDHNPY